MDKLSKVKVMSHRIPWIDNVKFLAIWCVIFGHFNGQIFTHGRPGFDIINLFIVIFNMPLFVFMSGYSNYKSLKNLDGSKSLWKYFTKTFERIILPCIIPCIMVYLIRPDMEYVDFKHYWFLVMLSVIQISTGGIFCITNKLRHGDIIGWGVFVIIMVCLNRYSTSELCWYYLYGGVVKNMEMKGKDIFKLNNKFYLLVPVGIVSFLFTDVYKYQFYNNTIFSMFHNGVFYLWILRMICACCLIYVIIYFVQMCSSKYNFISYMGSKTLGLYIWSGVLLDICYRYHIVLNGDNLLSWGTTILISFVAVLLTMAVIRFLELSRITNLLFFGQLK